MASIFDFLKGAGSRGAAYGILGAGMQKASEEVGATPTEGQREAISANTLRNMQAGKPVGDMTIWDAARDYAGGVAEKASDATLGAIRGASSQYKQEAAQGKRPVSLLNPDAKPATETPVGKAVEAVAPNAPAPAKAAVAQQTETQRQVVEQGAKNQLKSGELNRVDAAWAVVQADIQRSGEQLTPKQMEARVAEESTAMKSMDNDQLSRYLSYALVAGGLIASAVDKSGEAGRAFGSSLNAQLDRSQQAALFKYKQDAAAKAAAAKAAIEERKLETQEADVGSKISDRESQAAAREAASVLGRDKLAAQERRWGAMRANENARLAAYRERTAKGGASGKAATPPELSTKDATTLVDTFAKAKNVQIDDNAKATAADAYRRYRKAYPDLTADELMELTLGDLEKTEGEEGFIFDTPPSFGIKQ